MPVIFAASLTERLTAHVHTHLEVPPSQRQRTSSRSDRWRATDAKGAGLFDVKQRVLTALILPAIRQRPGWQQANKNQSPKKVLGQPDEETQPGLALSKLIVSELLRSGAATYVERYARQAVPQVQSTLANRSKFRSRSRRPSSCVCGAYTSYRRATRRLAGTVVGATHLATRTPSRPGDKVQRPINAPEFSRIDRNSFCLVEHPP